MSYVAPWSVTDADRRQSTSLAPYTMCRRASNNESAAAV